MRKVDCKQYAQEILDEVKAQPNKGKLAIVTVGEDPASRVYVHGKMNDCEYCGIPVEHIQIEDGDSAWLDLDAELSRIGWDESFSAAILQLPLPCPLDEDEDYFANRIPARIDVDGLSDQSKFLPCTPLGVMYVLHREIGSVEGLNALVIGRSKLVGKPLAKMLLGENATVTVAHSHTAELDKLLPHYDIVVSAVGKPNLVDLKLCHRAQIVVDIGINRGKDGKLCGDCFNFTNTTRGMKVTPVPGGIGLMTRAMLMKNVAEASK